MSKKPKQTGAIMLLSTTFTTSRSSEIMQSRADRLARQKTSATIKDMEKSVSAIDFIDSASENVEFITLAKITKHSPAFLAMAYECVRSMNICPAAYILTRGSN